MENPVGMFFQGTDNKGNIYIAECTQITQRKVIINFFDDDGNQITDIIPSSIKQVVFLVGNVPTVGTHLIDKIRGIYPTKKRALENVLDDGDLIIPIPFNENDNGKIMICGYYPRQGEK